MNCQVERLRPNVVVFSGNTHRPSKSRTLAHHLGEALRERASVTLSFLDLVDAGRGLGAAFSRKELTPEALEVVDAIEQADALIVTTPVYNGSYAGLFKHMFDLVDPLKLVDRPVLIGATGGGHRHALVVEHQLRPLFGFFSALTVPSAVYASDSDFVDGSLAEPLLLTRAMQAVDQLAALLLSRQTGASAASAPRYEQRAQARVG
ncbi:MULTISPECIES: FMN reductase [unclassified Mesorhizobium]|uniref:FMN reductase n=1 Tax=unclassified Mesorhizobium TaxID=325217 RepID=UPI000FCC5C8E|nr:MULTISPECIES: FMN reductase [unclassified Mesorhizobium]RUW32467.1 FMN reductase [Mesorhizobium sp. M1E.F.Ca.ET.041.01.1.1]RWD91864.1 MAG: FMN reductase [Mesorhizobium sp.]RWD95779.1 MAG: FMN reductase [Mesorhizobium sp.]TIV54840.1 MAG: FMN reductase [Mesorhizobium sp.]